MNAPSQEWEIWVKKKHNLMRHPCDFEARFVLEVLSRVSIITPNDVIPQYEFRDRTNKQRRIDFVILNEKRGYGLAIELDGLTKIDGYDKFEDLLNRQNDLLKYNDQTILMLFRFANRSWLTNPHDIAQQIEEELKREEQASIELLKTNQFLEYSRKAITQYQAERDALKEKLKSLENELQQKYLGIISLSKDSDLRKLLNELAHKESQLQQGIKTQQEAASKLISVQNKLTEERQVRIQEYFEKYKKDEKRDKDISFLKSRQLEHDKQIRITKFNTYLIIIAFILIFILCIVFLNKRNDDNQREISFQNKSNTHGLPENVTRDDASLIKKSNKLNYIEKGNSISTAESAQYIGNETTVCGVLEEVKSRGHLTYLNFDEKFPHNTFTGTIDDANAKEFIGINKRVGEKICIRGIIKRYGSKTGISLTNKSQLVR